MGSADKIEVVSVKELANYICSKSEGNSSVILSPSLYILIRITPQEITQQT